MWQKLKEQLPTVLATVVLVALIFGGMWAYATIKGASLDRRNAALADPRTPNGN